MQNPYPYVVTTAVLVVGRKTTPFEIYKERGSERHAFAHLGFCTEVHVDGFCLHHSPLINLAWIVCKTARVTAVTV